MRAPSSEPRSAPAYLKIPLRMSQNDGVMSIVMQALSSKRASRKELEEIRRLLDELEEDDA